MTATGAFATIILERLLDIVTVLALLASFVFVFGKDLGRRQPHRLRAREVGRRERGGRLRRPRSSSCSCWRAIPSGWGAR